MPSFSTNSSSSSSSLSFSSISSSLPEMIPFGASTRENDNRTNAFINLISHGTLSLEQLLKPTSYKNNQRNSSYTNYASNCLNQDCEHLSILDALPNNVTYKHRRKLKDYNSISIHIYLRIANNMTAGDNAINWLWVNATSGIEYRNFGLFTNDSSIKEEEKAGGTTVLKVEMTSLNSVAKKKYSSNHLTVKGTNIKILQNVTLLQYSYAPLRSVNDTLTKNRGEFGGSKMSLNNEEKKVLTSYSYLEIARISGKNLSVTSLRSLKRSLKLKISFFQNEILNSFSGMLDDVPSGCKSSRSIQKCVQKLLQVVYVINNNPNKTFPQHSRTEDTSKIGKSAADRAKNTVEVPQNHERHNGESNNKIASVVLPTELIKFKEKLNFKAIHYPSKSQTISTSNIPLFKIANNNSSAWLNKESALRTNSSHMSNSDLKGNVEIPILSKSFQPSSKSPQVQTRKNTFKQEWNKRKQPSTSSKLCKDWLDVFSSSSLIEIEYKPNYGFQNADIRNKLLNKQQSRKSTKNHNVRSGDGQFNKLGMRISTPKTYKDSSNSPVQLYCAAQIRLPHGYWPRIKVTVIQGKPNDFR